VIYKLPNGQRLGLGQAFTLETVQYPSNWLQMSSQEERAALGITEIIVAARPDDNYYWVTENDNGTFSTIAKDLEPLKAQKKEKIKQTAYSLLQPSDYVVLKAFEGGSVVPSEVLTSRAALRAAANANEALVDALTNVDELAALQLVWPKTQKETL
jgi:hypothetical protein